MSRTPSRRARRAASAARRRWTGARCAPARRCGGPARSTRPTARFSAPRGPGRAGSRGSAGPPASAARSIASASSACTISSAPSAATSRSAASSSAGSERRELRRTPECEQEALEAEHPGVVQPAQVRQVAGDRAAPEADVDVRLTGRGGPLDLAAPPRSTVGGMLLSGMSTIVVTPPAAAARVALAKPSHSVRPGSLTCTWVSTRPGSSTSRRRARPPRRRPARRRTARSRRSARRRRRRCAAPRRRR